LVGLIWSAPLFAAHVAAFIEAWAEIPCGSGLPKRRLLEAVLTNEAA
jgi:hypothetical protein